MSRPVAELASSGGPGPSLMASPQTRLLALRRALRAAFTRTVVWIALVDLGLMLLFDLLSPDRVFLGVNSLQNIGFNAAQIVVLSCAAAFELAAGEIDISLGAVLVLSSILGGEVMTNLAGSTAQVAAGEYPNL